MKKEELITYLQKIIKDYDNRIKSDEIHYNLTKENKQFNESENCFNIHKLHLIYACNLANKILKEVKKGDF